VKVGYGARVGQLKNDGTIFNPYQKFNYFSKREGIMVGGVK